jgi:integrase
MHTSRKLFTERHRGFKRHSKRIQAPLKVVQSRLGHASIQMTADTYGHLFPRGDDGAELAAAEQAFLRG